jgi:hypothetical protein
MSALRTKRHCAAPVNVRCVHFNDKESLVLIRIKNQLTVLVLRTTNMKRHKPQTRARSQCRLSLAAASRAKWWCVLGGASSLIVLTALEAAPAELRPGQAAADWAQEYGSDNKDCLEWSDTCVNCVRAQTGENFSCSNIGIACQPKEVRCNRRADEKPR